MTLSDKILISAQVCYSIQGSVNPRHQVAMVPRNVVLAPSIFRVINFSLCQCLVFINFLLNNVCATELLNSKQSGHPNFCLLAICDHIYYGNDWWTLRLLYSKLRKLD